MLKFLSVLIGFNFQTVDGRVEFRFDTSAINVTKIIIIIIIKVALHLK